MFVLTKHCKERIKKRIFKKKNIDNCKIWEFALEFAKKSKKIEKEKTIYFTNGRYTLVVLKITPKTLNYKDAIKILKEIKNENFCLYYNGKVQKVNKTFLLDFLKNKKEIVLSIEDIYIGKPYIALTFRPAKQHERILKFL